MVSSLSSVHGLIFTSLAYSEKEVFPPSNNQVENLESRIGKLEPPFTLQSLHEPLAVLSVELEALLQQMQVALEESQKNIRSSNTILPSIPTPHNAAEPSSTFSPVAAESVRLSTPLGNLSAVN